MRVVYKNHGAVKAKLNRLMANTPKIIKKVLDKEMSEIYRDSQEDVGKRTHRLEGTGKQNKAKGREVLEASVEYGTKKKAPYASPHEDDTKFLTKNARTGKIHKAIREALLKEARK